MRLVVAFGADEDPLGGSSSARDRPIAAPRARSRPRRAPSWDRDRIRCRRLRRIRPGGATSAGAEAGCSSAATPGRFTSRRRRRRRSSASTDRRCRHARRHGATPGDPTEAVESSDCLAGRAISGCVSQATFDASRLTPEDVMTAAERVLRRARDRRGRAYRPRRPRARRLQLAARPSRRRPSSRSPPPRSCSADLALWLALVITGASASRSRRCSGRSRPTPGVTLVSSAFSIEPGGSFWDSSSSCCS